MIPTSQAAWKDCTKEALLERNPKMVLLNFKSHWCYSCNFCGQMRPKSKILGAGGPGDAVKVGGFMKCQDI